EDAVGLSRISHPFGWLSRSPGQITHVLRTRAPLYSGCPFRARLACVRHAASVRSEPGSNSPIKLGEFELAAPSAHPRGRASGRLLFVSGPWPSPAHLSAHIRDNLQGPSQRLTAGFRNLLLVGLLSSFQRPSDSSLLP